MSGRIEKSRRVAAWVMQELAAIEPGAAEGMEFWKSRSHEHYMYFKARRDLMRDVQRILAIAIRRFFSDKDLQDIEKEHRP